MAEGSEKNVEIKPGSGVLHIHEKGYGFLRQAEDSPSGSSDIYLSLSQIYGFDLQNGDRVTGHVRPPKDDERYVALLRIETVNGKAREATTRRAEGYLHVDEIGYGFLRPATGSASEPEDTYVSLRQIKRSALAEGDHVAGFARPAKGDERFWALVKIQKANHVLIH